MSEDTAAALLRVAYDLVALKYPPSSPPNLFNQAYNCGIRDAIEVLNEAVKKEGQGA